MIYEFLSKINKRVAGLIFAGILLVIIMLIWKLNVISTRDNANTELLFQKDNTIDLFVYQNTAYVNAAALDWIKELKLTGDEYLGMIKRTNIKNNYKEFDATKLEEGTKVYIAKERKDILLVYLNNQYVPYYRYVEG